MTHPQLAAQQHYAAEFDAALEGRKVRLTKTQRAELRLAYAKAGAGGASLYDDGFQSAGEVAREQAREKHRIYVESWVLPRLISVALGGRA